jgi:hypothetical protein
MMGALQVLINEGQQFGSVAFEERCSLQHYATRAALTPDKPHGRELREPLSERGYATTQ